MEQVKEKHLHYGIHRISLCLGNGGTQQASELKLNCKGETRLAFNGNGYPRHITSHHITSLHLTNSSNLVRRAANRRARSGSTLTLTFTSQHNTRTAQQKHASQRDSKLRQKAPRSPAACACKLQPMARGLGGMDVFGKTKAGPRRHTHSVVRAKEQLTNAVSSTSHENFQGNMKDGKQSPHQNKRMVCTHPPANSRAEKNKKRCCN